MMARGENLPTIKGGHLEFSCLTEFKKIYITETYMKKQYKSSIFKNHRITKKNFFGGIPIDGYITS